jgi:hypothetical protein
MNLIDGSAKGSFCDIRWILCIVTCLFLVAPLHGQLDSRDSIQPQPVSTGWADEAVTAGIVTAPTVLGLMFVSGLVNDWNAGYAGIPASAMILLAPPLIYAGGRSADIPKEFASSRAKLGWVLYALSVIPTSLALYSFTTDWGATVPLTLASGILGSASIIAMTTYAFSRTKEAREGGGGAVAAWGFGISPLPGGAMASISYRF